MPGPAVEKISLLTTEVNEAVTVMGGAKTLIDGITTRIDAAVAAALANGATAEELAPIDQLSIDLDNQSKALATSVAAHTVAEHEPPPPPEPTPA